MTRSIWKGPFSCVSIKAQLKTKVWSRCSMILPQHLHKEFQVYNGKTFLAVKVSSEMIGHKFGEFAMTRKKPIHKKKSTKKK